MVIRLDYDRVAMLNRFRQFWTKVITPIANLLLKLGVSADAVTLVGTIGVSAGALIFFPRGQLWLGVVVITCFVFSDMIDGAMARTSGTSSKWGSFLDSTLDRLADAAIYGGLVMYYANSGAGDSTLMAAVTLWALVMGAVTSYARAKAESLGLKASGGLAERADRLVFTLILAFFSDVLNLPILLEIVIWAVAVASTITVIQRSSGFASRSWPTRPTPAWTRRRPGRTRREELRMGGLRQRAVDLAFALAWALVRRLPERTVTWLFHRAADRVVRRNGRGVRRLRGNLAVVRPDATEAELDALTRAGMRSYLRYWQEAFRLPEWSDVEIVGRVRTVNEKLVRDAYAAGPRCDLPAAAPRELRPRGRLGGPDRDAGVDRGRAPAARVAVRPLHRLPQEARHGGPPADGR